MRDSERSSLLALTFRIAGLEISKEDVKLIDLSTIRSACAASTIGITPIALKALPSHSRYLTCASPLIFALGLNERFPSKSIFPLASRLSLIAVGSSLEILLG